METILKFNKEDDVELAQAMAGAKLSYALWEFDQWLRSLNKYMEKDTVSVEECREKLRELMSCNDLTFDNKIFS